MIGAGRSVVARGSAKLGGKRHDSLAPGRAHIGFDRRQRRIERSEQLGQPALSDALLKCVSQPSSASAPTRGPSGCAKNLAAVPAASEK